MNIDPSLDLIQLDQQFLLHIIDLGFICHDTSALYRERIPLILGFLQWDLDHLPLFHETVLRVVAYLFSSFEPGDVGRQFIIGLVLEIAEVGFGSPKNVVRFRFLGL